MEWISVKDRLPEQYVDVLAWDASRDMARMCFHDPAHPENRGWLMGSYYEAEVTHWMPLPAPPKEPA